MSYRKYGNRRTQRNGMTFDSAAEARRYAELILLERAGHISALEVQPRYELVPKTRDERAVYYRADFRYIEGGAVIVEDVKGAKTRDYILKRKLLKWRYPDVEFREIPA